MKARLLLIMAAMMFLLTGCERPHKRYVIGVSQCSMDNWREKFNEELSTAALMTDSLTIRLESANDDDHQQIRQIEKFINDGVDLLIVSPNQQKTISSAVVKAYNKGIPVILYDRKSESEKYTAFIGCDNHQIGYAMGRYIAQRLGGKGHVAEIRGLEGSSPAIERHSGLVEALKEYSNVVLVASESGDWKRDSGSKAMKRILAQHRDIDYVFAHNDRMAAGARSVAEAEDVAGQMLFAGVDGLATNGGGLEMVRDGILDASYLYPTKGNEVAELAMRILTGKHFDRENYLQTSIVTRENAEISLMEAKDADHQRKNLGLLHRQVDSYISQYQSQKVITVALVFILLLLIALVAVIYRNLIYTARLNHQLDESNEKLRQLNEQVIEQTHSRLVFFTNISHELRTPLTLITDPIDRLMEDPSIRGRSRELLALIKRNAVALQQLVSTILDFRKIQNGKMDLQPSPVDLPATLKQWVSDFEPTAERKRISLHIDTTAFSPTPVCTDKDKLARIVFNLMSNALKYTPQGGDVYITLADVSGTDQFTLSFRDTGKGISAADCPMVFERFFQSKGSLAGTGIGLAVVKTYTELLHGKATVESREGEGANFIVTLPRAIEDSGQSAPMSILLNSASATVTHEEQPTGAPAEQPAKAHQPSHTILVIDDNEDIRQYMQTILRTDYHVLEAADGQQGLEIARSEVPDLIVCDVMMPGISGLDVCRTLKATMVTSHIPVIMLTAKSLDEQRAEGYECGADSYITKPFNSKVLLARIQNLLGQRALLRQRFAGDKAETNAGGDKTSPHEQTFMQQLRDIIDSHLADSDFTVEQLGAEIGLSRVQLYRKVKALTGTTVVDMLRRARLAKARQMLATTHRSISEVAYAVGFSSPSYFAKCFKDEYGISPGEATAPAKPESTPHPTR